ncbi:MAG: Arginine-tRNA ligase [Candidatus Wolfebacteria bacterium GW2011_GWA2_42_10]|uniref:Arginine--tRNA ligase n=2 Tax=Candidatus Wolfeibacteriota TaxID=1752735 RepID=A0A0G0XKC7_9BACT|nr:MAG: Arginine-tRNA ligase [Candidatus Wolfebacteria bacterium GW2011_GWB1_41_12]KKS25380.1 MAG: Arginine-tRNA ligase [Candidatus Wolfebacteria bacterium GW2011_GWA2_42_10]KKT56819.1 MAG: Arginine-tRNA ligase [Candidatus Wolfebacteria bacterium GW2011_GWA1_44_24]
MIKSIIENYLKKAIKENIEIEVFVSEGEQFGHYSTNVALKLAKIKKENPMEIAVKIASDVRHRMSDVFNKVEVAPPGFINFWLKPEVFQNELKEVLKKKEKYGKSQIAKRKACKIQIEFISANPTGPLTLANGRGGFLGDALANILEFCGYKIEREYYVNDTGNQILTLGKSILAAGGSVPFEEKFYKGEYVKKWAKKNSAIVKKYKDNPLKVGKLAAKDFLTGIKKVLQKEAKISFDRWTSENKHIHKRSYIKKTLNIFKKSGLVYEKDGAVWLKTTKFGDDKDRVLITGDNFPTYFLADSGHYLETKERGFSGKIAIWGPDHFGYIRRIQTAAEIMGFENSEIIITQAVRLMSQGKEVKMSKRTGEFVTFEELIKKVGVDATRFFFLMHSPDSHMDFNLDLAKERSLKNPVYYVQYAAVRCQSILKKSKIKGQKPKAKYNLLNTPEDINLIRLLARFSEVVEEAAGKLNPQILARYSLDLARQFHNFYEKERIIGENIDKNLSLARLELIKAVQAAFKNLFGLLGISMPKKM